MSCKGDMHRTCAHKDGKFHVNVFSTKDATNDSINELIVDVDGHVIAIASVNGSNAAGAEAVGEKEDEYIMLKHPLLSLPTTELEQENKIYPKTLFANRGGTPKRGEEGWRWRVVAWNRATTTSLTTKVGT